MLIPTLLAALLPAAYQAVSETSDEIEVLESGWDFGSALARMGDVDGDGRSELAVLHFPQEPAGSGVVWVVSGSLDRVIQRITPQAGNGLNGLGMCGVGDLDRDGSGDLAIRSRSTSAEESYRVLAFSGSTGELLFSVRGSGLYDEFGASISAAGDQNEDGIPDILIGAPNRYQRGAGSQAGHSGVYSGADGSMIRLFEGDRPDDRFGQSVAGGMDFDLDGQADLAVAAPHPARGESKGYVRLISGRTGLTLLTLEAAKVTRARVRKKQHVFGAGIRMLEDMNKDGRPELLVTELDDHTRDGLFAVIHSGLDGSVLARIPIEGSEPPHGEFDILGDVNMDGHQDFAWGRRGWPGSLSIVSSKDGSTIRRVTDPRELDSHFSTNIGASVVALGDLNGDRVSDYAVGLVTFYSYLAAPGEVWVLSGKDDSRIATLTAEVVSSWPVGSSQEEK